MYLMLYFKKTCIFEKLFKLYGKCPKFSYTKMSDKMAYVNSVDSDQTAPEGAI